MTHSDRLEARFLVERAARAFSPDHGPFMAPMIRALDSLDRIEVVIERMEAGDYPMGALGRDLREAMEGS